MTRKGFLIFIGLCSVVFYYSKSQSITYREKVMLHLDRHYYVAGDTLRFKAYVTEGFTNSLQPRSNILHVSLSDQQGNIVMDQVHKIEEGVAFGAVYLSDTLKNTIYQVNAYTNWMKNEGQRSFARIKIPVISRRSTMVKSVDRDFSTKIIARSRSGDLKEGKPDQIEVWLTDLFEDRPNDSLELRHSSGGLVEKVTVGKEAYHSFAVVPELGKYNISYISNGYIDKKQLTVSSSTGSTLLGVETRQGIRYYIQTPDTDAYRFSLSFRDQEVFEQQLSGKINYQLIMPRQNLLPGLLYASLKDQNQELLARHQLEYDPYQVELITETDSVKSGQAVKIEIKVDDTVTVSGSISVFKIPTGLDRVDPGFYVTNTSNGVHKSINWEGTSISTRSARAARVVIPALTEPSADLEDFLIEKDFVGVMVSATDSNEKALFYAMIGTDPRASSVKLTSGQDTFVPFPVNHSGGKGYFSTAGSYPEMKTAKMQGFDSKRQMASLLYGVDEEEIKGLIQETLENRAIGFYYRNFKDEDPIPKVVKVPRLIYPDQIFDIRDYVEMRDFNEFDFEIIADLRMRKRGDDYHYFIEEKDPYTGQTKGLHEKPALVLLNGVVVHQHGILGAIPFADLDSVYLNYDPLDFDGLEVGGVLQLFTKRPIEVLETYLGVTPTEISPVKPNEALAIRSMQDEQLPIVDYTIYWEPDLKFSSRLSRQFISADTPGNYMILFQGMTQDGQPISLFRSFVTE